MAIGARLLGLTRGDDALGTLRSVCRHPAQRQDLFASMHYLLVAYLGLHNMLSKANDRSLVGRLLEASDAELKAWLALVEREGDVAGLADLSRT